MNRAFWQDRRVLVTGHTGFKGGWLSLWLQALGAKVSGFALPPPTKPSLFDAGRVAEGMDSRFADLRDAKEVLAATRAAKPEIVLHLAAQPLVRQSYADPVETYATNVMGTVHLLEALRGLSGVRAVVIVTSDKCYENREWVWGYRENEPMGGFDPYSSSKGCVELRYVGLSKFFFPCATLCRAWRCDRDGTRGKRHRRRRLGGRPPDPGLHTCDRSRHAGSAAFPRCSAAMAARAGSACRLPHARGTAA